MYRHILPLALAALLVTPAAVLRADVQRDVCDRQAREASNFWGGRIPEFRIGPFTGRISGSVALGVSRSSGAPSNIAVPPGAGAYAREQREAAKAERYREIFDRCMARR